MDHKISVHVPMYKPCCGSPSHASLIAQGPHPAHTVCLTSDLHAAQPPPPPPGLGLSLFPIVTPQTHPSAPAASSSMNLHVSLPHLPQFYIRMPPCHLANKASLADHTCLSGTAPFTMFLLPFSPSPSSPCSPLSTYPLCLLPVSHLEGKLPCGWEFALVLFTAESTGLRQSLAARRQSIHTYVCSEYVVSSVLPSEHLQSSFPKVIFPASFLH